VTRKSPLTLHDHMRVVPKWRRGCVTVSVLVAEAVLRYTTTTACK